jgi:hypothetical protein
MSRDDDPSKTENRDESLEPENKKIRTKHTKKAQNTVKVPMKELADLTK